MVRYARVTDVLPVAVELPVLPVVDLIPVVITRPPPKPLVTDWSCLSVIVVKLAFVNVPIVVVLAASVSTATANTINVLVWVVVTDGVLTEVVAVASTPPAVTSNGEAVFTPLNAIIIAVVWSPVSATATFASVPVVNL